MKKFVAFMMVSMVLQACAPPAADTEQEQAVSKKEIRAAWDGFIERWEAEDAEALAGYYTKDGINIPPAAEIKIGRKAIHEFYSTLFSANLSSRYVHHVDQIQVVEDHAVEQGNFQVDWVRNDSSTWVFEARSLTHWVKDKAGKWKIQEFMFNLPPQSN